LVAVVETALGIAASRAIQEVQEASAVRAQEPVVAVDPPAWEASAAAAVAGAVLVVVVDAAAAVVAAEEAEGGNKL
jgi:phage terminase large subunit-like protein